LERNCNGYRLLVCWLCHECEHLQCEMIRVACIPIVWPVKGFLGCSQMTSQHIKIPKKNASSIVSEVTSTTDILKAWVGT
jgi:hypothetical protein